MGKENSMFPSRTHKCDHYSKLHSIVVSEGCLDKGAHRNIEREGNICFMSVKGQRNVPRKIILHKDCCYMDLPLKASRSSL